MNFPVVDVMKIFSWLQYDHNYGQSPWSIHLKVVCLRPGEVRESSRAPRSAKEVLNDGFGVEEEDQNDDGSNDQNEDGESGAAKFFGLEGKSAEAWMAVTMVAAMLIL